METIYTIYKGLYKYKRKHLYDYRKMYNRDSKNDPLDYENTLIKNNVSKFLYKFSNVSDFLEFVNDKIYNSVRGIKYLKNFRNIAENKRNERIR